MKTTKKQVKAGRGALIDPKTTKMQTSIRLDGDLVIWLQQEAARESIPYQTLINKLLRERMKSKSFTDKLGKIVFCDIDWDQLRQFIEDRVKKQVSELIEPRLDKVEQILKKHG